MALGNQTRKCKITINGSTKVSGSHTNYTVFLNVSAFPLEALDADGTYPMKTDGGDLRFFTDSNLTIEIARDIIFVSLDNNPANSLILVAVKIPSLTTVNKDIWVAYNDPTASDYARTDTYGRDNAYDSNWKLFYPMVGSWNGTAGEVVDRTANANDGQGGAGTTNKVPTRVAFQLLYGQDYDDVSGQEDMTLTSSSASLNITSDITMIATVNRSSGDANYGTIIYKGLSSGSASGSSYGMFLDASDKVLVILYHTSDVFSSTSNTALTDGTNNVIGATWISGAGADVTHYLNGSSDGTGSKPSASMTSHSNPLTTGTMAGGTTNPYEGKITFVSVHNVGRDSGWMSTYYNNVADISNFITVGTPEDVTAVSAVAQRIIFID